MDLSVKKICILVLNLSFPEDVTLYNSFAIMNLSFFILKMGMMTALL